MKKILALIVVSFLFVTNVNAASKCSYAEQTELNGKAGNVKVSYAIKEVDVKGNYINMDTGETYDTSKAEVFEITILNLSEDLYVVVTNDIDESVRTIRYGNTSNGMATFIWNNNDNITNFTFNIYSSDKTNCKDEVYKTLYLTTPRYNNLYGYQVCQGLEDFYLCQKYVNFNKVSEGDFYKKISQYNNKEIDDNGEQIVPEKTVFDKIINFIKQNKWFIVSGIVLVAGAVVAINYSKGKKQRDLGL